MSDLRIRAGIQYAIKTTHFINLPVTAYYVVVVGVHFTISKLVKTLYPREVWYLV